MNQPSQTKSQQLLCLPCSAIDHHIHAWKNSIPPSPPHRCVLGATSSGHNVKTTSADTVCSPFSTTDSALARAHNGAVRRRNARCLVLRPRYVFQSPTTHVSVHTATSVVHIGSARHTKPPAQWGLKTTSSTTLGASDGSTFAASAFIGPTDTASLSSEYVEADAASSDI